MSKKSFLFLFAAFVVSSNSLVFSADPRSIDSILKSATASGGAISSSDGRVIEAYVSMSMEEMINAESFSEIASIRREVELRSIEKRPSQYSLAFSGAIEKSINPFLREVESFPSAQKQTQLIINLMILVAEVESMELADFCISMLDHENIAVRYWAVKGLSNDGIARQLKVDVTGDKELVGRIISAFAKRVNDDTAVEILDQMVQFADGMDTAAADSLLNQIADVRIKAYSEWTVKYELMDGGLLKALAGNMKTPVSKDGKENAAAGRRFGQLYSYMIHRYILGFDSFNEKNLRQLASIIADVELKSISKLVGSQNDIKRIVSGNSARSLELLGIEHDKLLGSETKVGRLCYELGFDYGTAGGKAITAPKKLTAPKVGEDRD